jgi:hypothetical protein
MKYVIAILSAIVALISTMSIVVHAQVVEYPIYTLTFAPISPDESLVYYITTVTMQSSKSSSPQIVLECTTGTFTTDPGIGSVVWTELYGFLTANEPSILVEAWSVPPYCVYGPRGSISYLSITQSQLEKLLHRKLAKTPHKSLSTQIVREDDTQKLPVGESTYSLDVQNYPTSTYPTPGVTYTIYQVYATAIGPGTPILQMTVGNYSSQVISEQVNWTALYGFKSATEAYYVINHWPGGAGNTITEETLVHELLKRSLVKVPYESLTSKVSKIQP